MPPKPRFTREEIIAAALDIVSREGAEALTARDLGEALGSSARPIFTVFKNMEEVSAEVRNAAMCRFEDHVRQSQPEMPLFKQIGMGMVQFGMQEPKLYQLLFMQEHQKAARFADIFGELGGTAPMCIEALCRDHGVDWAEAEELFENMWIYTFGVGTLCAMRACSFSNERLSEMLTAQFQAQMLRLKAGAQDKAGRATDGMTDQSAE